MRFTTNTVFLTIVCCLGQRALAQDYFSASSTTSNPHGGWVQESSGDETESYNENEREKESPFDEPIETDRHDFTQSPKVVGRGVMQFEYGFFYSSKEDGTERETTYTTPELFFRYGLTDRLELRTRFNYAWKFNNEDDDFNGAEDLRLSIKYQLSEQCGRRPDSAIEIRMSAPTGGDALTTGRWESGFDYIYGWEIGDYFTFAGSTGGTGNALGDVAFIDVDLDPDDHFIAWSQSLALGAKLTSRSTGYFEWFGLFTHGRDDESSLSFLNFGIDYLLNKNLVMDVRIGWGLTEDSDDLFAGVGGAFRF